MSSIEVKLTGAPRLFFGWIGEEVDSLLDIGCASSFMLDILGKKAKKKFGLDFDIEKLTEAKVAYSNIHYIGGSGEYLPFKNNSFDIVTFSSMSVPSR